MNNILKMIYDNIPTSQPLAISFSGGIDSSILAILAKMKNNKIKLYTLALDEKAEDLKYSRRFAQDIGLELEEVKGEIKDIFYKWIKITDRVKAEVMAGVELIVRATKEEIILFGSGSEEIFAGYDRHFKALDLKATLKEEFKELANKEIKYIKELCESLNKKAIFPFYNNELFEYVINNYSSEQIIKDKERKKAILREAAKEILPDYIINRPKKALQYGSKINKLISKLVSSNPR